jgi:RNA polymerase sigma factor (sigma-70 family)
LRDESTHPSLLSRVRDASDHAAWREFDAKYRDLILRYCWRSGLQPADAEDVRQVVMMGLARALKQFRYDARMGRFRTYLGRAVHHAIHRTRATAARLPAVGSGLDELHGNGRYQEDDAWRREWIQHHYRQAFERVRDGFEPRSVRIFERLLDGASAAECAAEFGTTEAAAYKIKERVRRRLREQIERQLAEEEFPERLASDGSAPLEDGETGP